MKVVVSYDITETKLRQRVSKILEKFGERVQYSVFECALSRDQYTNLITELKSESLLKSRKNCKIYIYPIDGHTVDKIQRAGKKPLTDDVMIV